MHWQAMIPTRLVFGERVVQDQYTDLQGIGKRALVVSGIGGSAERNSALDDVQQALRQANIKWKNFSETEANPSITTLRRAAEQAREFKADMIVAVGGGSSIDAGKGIAVLAAEDVGDEELIAASYTKVLPIVAIPTTAGTGSEVTPSAIITFEQHQNKKNIGSPLLLPQLALLDPRYTYESPRRLTIDTAIDAYAHALESYLAFRSNPLSDTYSQQALSILGPYLEILCDEERTLLPRDRERLMLGSLLAGMAISLTGVSVPHGISYPLTYYRDIPHGRALAYVIPSWMAWNMRMSHNLRLQNSLRMSGFTHLQELGDFLEKLGGPVPQLTGEERARFLQQSMSSKNMFNSIVFPQEEDIKTLLDEIFA